MRVKNLLLGFIIIHSLLLSGQDKISNDQESIKILNCDKLEYGLYYSFDITCTPVQP